MEKYTKSVLPYVLDLLSRQPDLCKCFSRGKIQLYSDHKYIGLSVDELYDQIKDIVADVSPDTYKTDVDFALKVGTHLGILSITKTRARTAFNFGKKLGPTKLTSIGKILKRRAKPKRAIQRKTRH